MYFLWHFLCEEGRLLSLEKLREHYPCLLRMWWEAKGADAMFPKHCAFSRDPVFWMAAVECRALAIFCYQLGMAHLRGFNSFIPFVADGPEPKSSLGTLPSCCLWAAHSLLSQANPLRFFLEDGPVCRCSGVLIRQGTKTGTICMSLTHLRYSGVIIRQDPKTGTVCTLLDLFGVPCVPPSLWQSWERNVLDTFGSGCNAIDTVPEVLHQ